jgi:hypothetical protein
VVDHRIVYEQLAGLYCRLPWMLLLLLLLHVLLLGTLIQWDCTFLSNGNRLPGGKP